MDGMKTAEKINLCMSYIEKKLISGKTDLIYDHIVCGNEGSFPTENECRESYPNPEGYGTGMEDCMISGATMLDGLITMYERTESSDAARLASRIANGMLKSAESAESLGFIPRGVIPSDGKSHYIDSSIDQYTLFVFGMHRYFNSVLCTRDDKTRIKNIAAALAERASKNVTKKNNYDILRDDGGTTLCGRFWNNNTNHEKMRLPMIYAFAWETNKDSKFLKKYEEKIYEAIEKSLPMTSYWHLYAIHQMQVSLKVCYDIETDSKRKAALLNIMCKAAEYTADVSDNVRAQLKDAFKYNLPQISFRNCEMKHDGRFSAMNVPNDLIPIRADNPDYWTLQDAAIVSIVCGLVPDTEIPRKALELLNEGFDKIDFKIHQRSLPVQFFAAFCRTEI